MFLVGVDTVAVVSAPFFGEVFEDFSDEGGVGLAVAEVIIDGGEVTVGGGRWLVEREIEGEGEFASDGGDAAGNVCAVDRTRVPSVGGGLGNGNEQSGRRCRAVRGGNSERFVVMFGDGVEGKLEAAADVFEGAAEFTVGVDNHEEAKTDFE